MAEPTTTQLATRAREAVTAMRDACRDGIVLNHHRRDPLVVSAHAIIDRAETLQLQRDALLAACKAALPLVGDYLQGVPELHDQMRAAIALCDGAR